MILMGNGDIVMPPFTETNLPSIEETNGIFYLRMPNCDILQPNFIFNFNNTNVENVENLSNYNI